jgi:hypothetical protein
MRRGRKIAKVSMARKLAVGLSWMWRKGLGIPLLFTRESELVIMIEVATEEMHGSD